MEAGVISTASKGSLAAVGSAAKAFVITHPLVMATTGGAVLGVTTYYLLGKVFRKKPAAVPAVS